MTHLNDLVLDYPRMTADQAAAGRTSRPSNGLFGEDGFSFWDFLDIINPLQHIPVVSTIYRAVTADTIDPGSRIAGGTLFGGPIGLVGSLVSAMVQESTGKDPGEHAMAMLGIDLGGEDKSEPAVVVAQAPDAVQANGRVPPELLAMLQPPPRSDLKLAVRSAPPRDERAAPQTEGEAETQTHRPAAPPSAVPIAAPAASPATAQRDIHLASAPAAVLAARTRALEPGARSNAPPVRAAPQVIDGKTWFPAFPQGGAAPVRGVGTQPVTQLNVAAKFGSTAAQRGAAYRSETPPSADWADRAAAAYQKYFDAQQRRQARGQQDGQGRIDLRY